MVNAKQAKSSELKIVSQESRIIKLENSSIYYKEITETIREPFIVLNEELRVVSANLAFYRTFKVLKRDTEGHRIYNLGNNQWDAPELKALLEDILPKKRILRNYEVTHNFPGIGNRTMLVSARRVDHKQLILMAMEDVTAKKQLKKDTKAATEYLIKQRDQLRRLNDAKDEFISLASHQLRTPATVVKQYVGILTHGYAGYIPNDQLRMLNIIDKSNERQLDIIEDLLRVAKVDAGKVYLNRSECDLSAQIQRVIANQAILFKNRQQRVIYRKPSSKVTAYIDAKLMGMVLENLLDNAGKYSRPGGKVRIKISQTNNHTIVVIKDHGVGINKRDQAKLFKKFSRINNPLSTTVPGTGLGLYWAKKILDLHKGNIEVVSGINKGSVFTVTVPSKTQAQ